MFNSFIFYILFYCFFFNVPAPTAIYTLSLHDALPISSLPSASTVGWVGALAMPMSCVECAYVGLPRDRKSTRLNSSHRTISYAVFCLKKKKIQNINQLIQK